MSCAIVAVRFASVTVISFNLIGIHYYSKYFLASSGFCFSISVSKH